MTAATMTTAATATMRMIRVRVSMRYIPQHRRMPS
jgi:hypothetical protein